MTQDALPNQAPVSRRHLMIVGAGASAAAVAGIGISAALRDESTAPASPATTESTLQAGETSLPTAPPTEQQVAAVSTEEADDDTIGFEEDGDSTPEPDQAPAETQPAEDTTATEDEASPAPGMGNVDPATVLEEVTIAQLREYLDGGAFTIAELIEATLARIEEYDDGDIALNAVITINPEAAEIAAELDTELAAGQSRGLLHGIPVLLKDIIATGDQMPNTAGSLALEEQVANKDSWVAALLREAGAVILGKTNLTQWSNYMGAEAVSGYSSMGGITVNPYNLNMSASGSSTGSAVAVAASYVPIAIGAEFDGSIITPAAQCGVVGVKPTVGLVGRSGVIPIGFTRDSIGPMARTVTDAAIALEVLAGIDPDDPGRTVGAATAPWAAFETDPVPQPGAGDYTSRLSADALKGKKIAIASNMGDYDEGSQALFLEAVELIKQAGAEVIEASVGVDGDYNTYTETSLPEFAWGLTTYLETYTPDGPMMTIQDIVDFGDQNADEVISGVADQSGLVDALTAISLDDPVYIEETQALVTGARTNGVDASMDEAGVDAFIAPTCGTSVGVWDHTFKGASSGVVSLAGYPAVTVPIGLADDLPVGINFFGRAYSEADLLAFAYALEQLLPARAVPTYIPREE